MYGRGGAPAAAAAAAAAAWCVACSIWAQPAVRAMQMFATGLSNLAPFAGGFDIELFRRAAKQLGWVESECMPCSFVV